MKNIPMRTATHAVADMTIPMSMKNIPMRTATHAVVDMTMSMHTLIPMLTTFRDIQLTASAKSAIRMRNTAMFAAKA